MTIKRHCRYTGRCGGTFRFCFGTNRDAIGSFFGVVGVLGIGCEVSMGFVFAGCTVVVIVLFDVSVGCGRGGGGDVEGKVRVFVFDGIWVEFEGKEGRW